MNRASLEQRRTEGRGRAPAAARRWALLGLAAVIALGAVGAGCVIPIGPGCAQPAPRAEVAGRRAST